VQNLTSPTDSKPASHSCSRILNDNSKVRSEGQAVTSIVLSRLVLVAHLGYLVLFYWDIRI